ncbi:antibiotic biosynthesis monooxygenase family protein, partial [Salmonella enterica]|uniref:antibiotic biosynthesis monooxygenase family protein n=1 Tax=Salmonella enterica TaxID=28901 RepID=UPI003D27247C
MFAVIYRFQVKAGYESQFESAWAQRTAEIKTENGGLGSRLHKSFDGSCWIAYAQWPSREILQAAGAQVSDSAARSAMQEACEKIETLHELDV